MNAKIRALQGEIRHYMWVTLTNDPWSVLVTKDRLIFATHNAEHAKLSNQVRQSVQHLNELMGALHRKATAISNAVAAYKMNAFGIVRPSPDEQQILCDLYREFFETTYTAISALASTLNRLNKRVTGVPFSSNEKFIRWIRTDGEYYEQGRSADALQAARDFRTVFSHSAQWKPFDWSTSRTGPREVGLVLHGPNPPLPPGAVVDPMDPSLWYFVAPRPNDVLWAFATIAGFYFGTLFPHYEEDPDRCTWEADGKGSAPGIALEQKVTEVLAQLED